MTGFSYHDFVTRRTDFESGGQGGGFGEVVRRRRFKI